MKKQIKNKDMIVILSVSLIIALIAWKALYYLPNVFGFLDTLYSLLIPFIYAFVIAYILNPIVKLFRNRLKITKNISILLAYIVFIGAGVILAFVAVPNIYESISDIISQIPHYSSEAQSFVYKLLENAQINEFIESSGITTNINQMIAQFGDLIVKLFDKTIVKIFSVTTSVVNIVLGMIISIYVISDKDRFKREIRRFLTVIFKEEKTNELINFVKTFNYMIGSYIGIKAIDSSIIGVLAFILLNIVGSEYALFLSIIVAITNMIPYFGPFIGEVVGVLFNIFVSPMKALVVFIVLFSLQMFDGWYLDPKLVGDKVGVRPFWIILAVIIGGGFYGPIGMLLASPAIATLKIYYERFIQKREAIMIQEQVE